MTNFDSTPIIWMQYTVIIHGCKNCDIIFAQNIDHGSNRYPQSMFRFKNKKPE